MVLQCEREGKFRRIPGYPDYYIDMNNGDIYSLKGSAKKLISQRVCGGCSVALKDAKNRSVRISNYRMVASLTYNIPYKDLPNDVRFHVTDGELTVSSSQDSLRKRESNGMMDKRVFFIDEHIEELHILREAFLSGDSTPLTKYLESRRMIIIAKFARNSGRSWKSSLELFDEAAEWFIRKVEEKQSMSYQISGAVLSRMIQRIKEKRNATYSDNFNYTRNG